jgi:hypothetical protein
MIRLHPPEEHLKSRDALAQYLCKLHNKVNLRLHHPIFDCNLVGDRWKCGCAGEEERILAAVKKGDRNDPDYDAKVARLDPVEQTLLMEHHSLFDEDYATLVQERRQNISS